MRNCAANQATAFDMTDTNLNVPIMTLSTDDNAKLLQRLKSWFKCRINGDKYARKTTTQNAPNKYFDFLSEISFKFSGSK